MQNLWIIENQWKLFFSVIVRLQASVRGNFFAPQMVANLNCYLHHARLEGWGGRVPGNQRIYPFFPSNLPEYLVVAPMFFVKFWTCLWHTLTSSSKLFSIARNVGEIREFIDKKWQNLIWEDLIQSQWNSNVWKHPIDNLRKYTTL